MMWICLLIGVFILFIVFMVSLIILSYKIIKNYVKNKVWAIIISFLPVLLIVIGLIIDSVDAIVVYLHLMFFIYLTKLVFFMISKIRKKQINKNIILVLGTIVTVIVMCKGYYNVYNVKETRYELITSKSIEPENFRIVQISDSHLGTTMDGKKFAQYMEKINKFQPEIVVVTGDFIDDGTSYEDFVEGAKGLGNLKTKYGVYFVYGNHDKGYYNKRNYNDKDIKNVLKDNNVTILEDECVDLTENIVLIGRQDKQVSSRKSIQELTNSLDKNKYIIVLNHQPNDYDNEMNSGVDLVLSGHTHGGQLFPLGQLGVLIGANDKMYGIEKRKNTTFIVNSGISDWAMKFKTGTFSEYVVVDLQKVKIH